MDALTRRRMERAAGDHPLQKSFRAASAALLLRHGVKPTSRAVRDLKDAQDEHDGASSEEEGDSGDEGASSEEEAEGQHEEEGLYGGEGSGQGTGEEDEGTEANSDEEEVNAHVDHVVDGLQDASHPPTTNAAAGAVAPPTHTHRTKPALELPGPLELPFTLPLPEDVQGYQHLMAGRSAEDVDHIVQRLRNSNASILLQDSRRGMQELYGMIMQHFALAAGETPLPMPLLDVLARHLADLTPMVPAYAAKAAQARLTAMVERLQQCLSVRGYHALYVQR